MISLLLIPSLSAWSYWKAWRHMRNGALVFNGRPLGVRFDRGAGDVTREGIMIKVVGDIPSAGVEVRTQLLKRKDIPTPQDPGLMVKLSTGWCSGPRRRDQAPASGTPEQDTNRNSLARRFKKRRYYILRRECKGPHALCVFCMTLVYKTRSPRVFAAMAR